MFAAIDRNRARLVRARAHRLVLALGILAAAGAMPRAARALPPYAEEWATPNSTPEDVEVDAFGHVWVTCSDDSVRVYRPTGGELLFAFGGSGGGDGQFTDPFGMQFAADGSVYICDYAGARVEKFTGDGVFLLQWPIPSARADHVAIDAAGDVYVTGFPDQSIHKYSAAGDPILDWAATNGGRTSGVLVVGDVLHVGAWDVAEIEQYALDGTYLGAFPIETEYAVDIEQDDLGQLWVTDWINHVVRIYSAIGEPVDVLGEPGSGPGQFDGPAGLDFGIEGSVYVADQLNGRIQRFGNPITDVAAPGGSSQWIALRSIAPNPCRTTAAFTYALPRAGRVEMTITDASGRRVATLEDGVRAAGDHSLQWEARDDSGRPLAAGHYFLRLESGSGVSTGRLVVVK